MNYAIVPGGAPSIIQSCQLILGNTIYGGLWLPAAFTPAQTVTNSHSDEVTVPTCLSPLIATILKVCVL